MQRVKSILLTGVNEVRKRLGDEDVDSQTQLKCIHSELQELRRDVAHLESGQREKLDRIESGIHENHQLMSQLARRVDKALQPRWRSLILLTAACVITTVIVMLMLF
jgi:t-SNARE complex subunit (syntaxin)